MIISITMNPKPKKLLDRVRETIRLKKYTDKTGQAYLIRIKQYILFHDKNHPRPVDTWLYTMLANIKSERGGAMQAMIKLLLVWGEGEIPQPDAIT